MLHPQGKAPPLGAAQAVRKGGDQRRPSAARPKRGNVMAPQGHGLPPRRGMMTVERLTGTKCPKGSPAGTAKPCRPWIPATAAAQRGCHTPAPPWDIFGSVHVLPPCARDRHRQGRDPQGLGKCSELQSSVRGIAIIGRSCPRSLQRFRGAGPTITATGRIKIATGIAIVGVVPTLIATARGRGRHTNDRFLAHRTLGAVLLSPLPVSGKQLSQVIKCQVFYPATGFVTSEAHVGLAVSAGTEIPCQTTSGPIQRRFELQKAWAKRG
jgi:hypothetical protein